MHSSDWFILFLTIAAGRPSDLFVLGHVYHVFETYILSLYYSFRRGFKAESYALAHKCGIVRWGFVGGKHSSIISTQNRAYSMLDLVFRCSQETKSWLFLTQLPRKLGSSLVLVYSENIAAYLVSWIAEYLVFLSQSYRNLLEITSKYYVCSK